MIKCRTIFSLVYFILRVINLVHLIIFHLQLFLFYVALTFKCLLYSKLYVFIAIKVSYFCVFR